MQPLTDTPSADRLHIGFYGKMNSGKSALINAFVGQDISIVSEIAGTTTDPVLKPMEIHGLGACVLIDTAGFDDNTTLGEKRILTTRKAADKTDIAVILFHDEDIEKEAEWYHYFRKKNTPVIAVLSKSDSLTDTSSRIEQIEELISTKPLIVSAVTREGIEELKDSLIRSIPVDYEMPSLIRDLISEGEVCLLVMPQDLQAPKGRLILPQVQVIRSLLDQKCLVMSVTTDKLELALKALTEPPKLIITDSQVFKAVYEMKPEQTKLTSFSMLFAAYKGDINYYRESAYAIDKLTEQSKVLIAECCTHAPLEEDIGREKLPRMLRKKVGEALQVDIVSGMDFPKDLTGYDLIIQCGACMFNRKYVMSRLDRAKEQQIPMSNYGVAIAYLGGILDKVE
ncbi:MAG TPA: [FeFe] hydrogenase H-cluster maturation GTPase HydF [Mobilitalea sp.]|nr:[FeFe] hydrogenase H-cluster maturation GTPase HydF [Mobilitalea sp.]